MALSAPLRETVSLSELPELIHGGREDWSGHVTLSSQAPVLTTVQKKQSKAGFEHIDFVREKEVWNRCVNTSLPLRQ